MSNEEEFNKLVEDYVKAKDDDRENLALEIPEGREFEFLTRIKIHKGFNVKKYFSEQERTEFLKK